MAEYIGFAISPILSNPHRLGFFPWSDTILSLISGSFSFSTLHSHSPTHSLRLNHSSVYSFSYACLAGTQTISLQVYAPTPYTCYFSIVDPDSGAEIARSALNQKSNEWEGLIAQFTAAQKVYVLRLHSMALFPSFWDTIV